MSIEKLNGRRKAEKHLPTLNHIITVCNRAEDRTAFIIAFLYLSGRRISEVIGLRRKDITIDRGIILFDCLILKDWHQKKAGDYNLEVERNVSKDRKVVGSQTFYYHKERIFFSLNSETGRPFKDIVLNYLQNLREHDYLFHHESNDGKCLTRFMVYKLLRRADNDLWCHLLRHKRFTDFAIKLRGDVLYLNEFTKHKRLESDREYVHREETREAILSV